VSLTDLVPSVKATVSRFPRRAQFVGPAGGRSALSAAVLWGKGGALRSSSRGQRQALPAAGTIQTGVTGLSGAE